MTRLMEGFPPQPASQVTLANWRKPPFNAWSFSHVRELIPTVQIKGTGRIALALPNKPANFAGLTIECAGQGIKLDDFIAATATDMMVILHQGQIAHEYYRADLGATTPHILMSVSKSMLGLLFGILADQGVLEETQQLTDWLPELRDSAYAQANLRHLLDMRVGVQFDENYQASQGAIIAYRKAQGWDPIEAGEEPNNLRAFFTQLSGRDGAHGDAFHYVSPNTDLLGWVIERATGKRYADLFSELIWQPLGAETDAYITVDRLGAPRCAGGHCTSVRDLARVGLLIANQGKLGQTKIIPQSWLEDMVSPAGQQDLQQAWDKGDFISYFGDLPVHYRSKWYLLRQPRKILFGLGVFGQNLFVDFDTQTVIAKFSSQPLALDKAMIDLTLAAVQAIGLYLTDC